MRISQAKYLRIIRASALYDLGFAALFITPWGFAAAISAIASINDSLGGAPLPTFGPLHVLFAGLMASGVLSWSLLRLRRPLREHGRYDALARLVYAGWVVWALNVSGASVLWLFLLPQLLWAVAQAMPLFQSDEYVKGSGLSML